jgi:hypothetical protein
MPLSDAAMTEQIVLAWLELPARPFRSSALRYACRITAGRSALICTIPVRLDEAR